MSQWVPLSSSCSSQDGPGRLQGSGWEKLCRLQEGLRASRVQPPAPPLCAHPISAWGAPSASLCLTKPNSSVNRYSESLYYVSGTGLAHSRYTIAIHWLGDCISYRGQRSGQDRRGPCNAAPEGKRYLINYYV